jgi:hypothetical protein
MADAILLFGIAIACFPKSQSQVLSGLCPFASA